MFKSFIFLIILKILLSSPYCKEGENNCSRCNPVTKLCIKCQKEIYTPNSAGGCDYLKKCQLGKNYCNECSPEGNLCKICENGYFPDEIGGCTYTDNCEVSKKGQCIKCKENYALIGVEDYYNGGLKICKYLYLEELKNCDSFYMSNGICYYCKKGFYLNSGDKKCINTEHCYESSNDVCKKCDNGYYLDKIDNKCKIQNGLFNHCKESDGETCILCDNYYYLSEDKKCSSINYCKIVDNGGKCKKCISGYFMSEDGYSCTPEINCKKGDEHFGICQLCKDNFYIDNNDKKCKSNIDENNIKYCKILKDGVCTECIIGYAIGEDHKCSTSYDCKRSVNTTCVECSHNYFLTKNNFCTNVERCVLGSFYILGCVECEENYYYDEYNMECKLAEGNFINCKSSEDLTYCQKCRDDFYLNLTDNLCYSNKAQNKFYKCLEANITEESGEYECIYCIDNYYLGSIDKKCNTMDGCEISQNENKCIKCEEYCYCFDVKTSRCVPNDEIISEDKKYYYRCNRTNKEGTACEVCLEGFILNEDGICVDKIHCIDKKGGKCQRCQNDENGMFCLNEYFGCEEIYDRGCWECNNLFDLFSCTKCLEGYELNQNGKCIDVKED